MTNEELRNLNNAVPFQPFVLHLADRRTVPVQHHDFVIISPSGRTAIVYQPDDSFNIIDLRLVTDLEVKRNGNP